MTVLEFSKASGFEVLNLSDEADKKQMSGVYCCDLLSVVMSKGFEGCAWVTIMSNINAVAVASLVDMGCIILADGCTVDEMMIKKAQISGINVLKSDKPIFETAVLTDKIIKDND